MKKVICVLLIALSAAYAQDKLYTLEESVNSGLKNNKLLKISASKLKEADFLYNEKKSGILPKLELGASYTRLSDVDPFTVSVPFADSPIKIQDAVLDNYSITAQLTQPLFTGFRLSSNINAAEFNKESVTVENEEEANKVSLNVIKSFWEFNKAKLVNRFLQERLSSVKKHVADSKSYLENGLITKNELLKLQVLESNTKIKLLESQDNIELARIAFNRAIGIELNSVTDVSDQIYLEKYNLEKFEKYLEEALQNRNELKITDWKLMVAKEKIKISGASFYPQINLFASFNYDNPNQRYMPLKDDFNDSWAAGVSLKWEIWNWGETSNKSQQAQEKYYQYEISKKLLKEKIENEVYRNYLRLKTIAEQLSSFELMEKQTEENVRITKTKYSEHLVTASDLADAETDLLEAKINLTKIKIDKIVLFEVFKKSLGRKLY